MQNNKFKWKYTNNVLSEEKVLKEVHKGEINLSGCRFSVESDEFHKIRSALDQERSPMEQQDQRLRKTSNN